MREFRSVMRAGILSQMLSIGPSSKRSRLRTGLVARGHTQPIQTGLIGLGRPAGNEFNDMNSSIHMSCFAVLLCFLVVSCDSNTEYAKGLDRKRFESIPDGASKQTVVLLLGQPLFVYFAPEHGPKEDILEIYRYSRPIDKKADFVVVDIAFDNQSRVFYKRWYKTD